MPIIVSWGYVAISCFLHFAAQPVSAGGPKNANCAYPGKPFGGPCSPGHEQCCPGGPNSSCPMRAYTQPAAVFHLGNTQGCGENDPNGTVLLFIACTGHKNILCTCKHAPTLPMMLILLRRDRTILRSLAWCAPRAPSSARARLWDPSCMRVERDSCPSI